MPTRPVARLIRNASAALLVSALTLAPAWGQQAAAKADADNTKLLKDYIHYVLTDNREMAAATAKALTDLNLKPAEFANLVEASGELNRFQKAIIQAQVARGDGGQDLGNASSRLLRDYERGKLDQARNATEISKNIRLLTGTQRNRIFAVERLKAAGEYAMPQLLQALLQRNDPTLQAEVRQVLIELGRQAVLPLCTAISGLDAVSQETVASVLGDLENPTALPFLYELHGATRSDPVRTASEVAIRRISGAMDSSGAPSKLFLDLAEAYYAEAPSLTSFPGESDQLLWTFDPGVGLVPTAINTAVYHEAMAMRMSERSLTLDPRGGDALSLWLASNFKREIETPKGYENPAYAADRRDAMYYAVAAGPVATQRVLARAVDTRATTLARRAIAAIERTAGTEGLWESQSSRHPLLESLRYPNRRVQYEAALAVASAQPRVAFDASERVVPILASAVRDAAARYAIILVGGHQAQGDTERYNDLADLLRSKGYEVLPPAENGQLAKLAGSIAEKPGIDLIVTVLPVHTTDTTIAEIRGSSRLAATPVLALTDLQGISDLNAKYQRDPTVRLAREGLSHDQIAAAAEQLIETASGGAIAEDEAREYKGRALSVLRDLAVSGNATLNVADAAGPLINALGANHGELKLKIAEVLSYMPAKAVQVALMDSALGAQGDERVAMLAKAAAAAKRFGNQLEQRQVSRIVDLAVKGGGDEATAAAALMGALNLSNDQLIPLIINAKAEPRSHAAEAAR